MALIPETSWGLVYMSITLALMVPCLFSAKRKGLSIFMLTSWLFTRITVDYISLEFSYLAVAAYFTLGAIWLLFKGQRLLPFCFASISAAGILASYSLINLNVAGTIYEVFGVFAMLIILDPDDTGYAKRGLFSAGNNFASIAFNRLSAYFHLGKNGHVNNDRVD